MSNPAVRSNTLQVPPNTAIEIVPKFPMGREITTQFGTRVMFTLMDESKLWLEPEDAAKIHALGLAQNEPLRVFKHVEKGKTPYWVFSRTVDNQRPEVASQSSPAAVSVVTDRPRSTQGVSLDPQVQHTPELPKLTQLSHDMASCHIAAIDALLVSKDYAESRKLHFAITPEMIHTTANTLYIQLARSEGNR